MGIAREIRGVLAAGDSQEIPHNVRLASRDRRSAGDPRIDAKVEGREKGVGDPVFRRIG